MAQQDRSAAVFVQTNDARENTVLAFPRIDDGRLAPPGRATTGGRGTGTPHLPSQGSVALTDSGRHLLVVNAGSDEVSLFALQDVGLRLVACVGSGGSRPTSVAVSGDLVYVLNNGTPNVAAFRMAADDLVAIEESVRPLSADDADPAQVAFGGAGDILVVTERGTDRISTYALGDDGTATGPVATDASGRTPYGFGFARDGSVIVTEAFGGATGAAAASSYLVSASGELTPLSRSVPNTRSEMCWAAVTDDGRFAYVTNFGDGTISSYEIDSDGRLALRSAVAGSTRLGEKGIRDEAISRDGRFLYAIDTAAGQVFGWSVGDDGELQPVAAFDGLPETVAGLAAS
jgi:6-phosphogluconolactonase